MLLLKKFSGDLAASARGQMLSASTGMKGSAAYVAIDQVTGELDGRRGSFVLQHSGSMNRGVPTLSIMVVPDSGTGELAGLTGTLSINIIDGKHFYDFIYSLPERARLKASWVKPRISMSATNDKQLAELLAHPSVWRGRSRAALETLPTGFPALDAGLPGGGWPRHGLVEILTPEPGVGELYLLLPALAAAVARDAGALVHLGVAAARALRARARGAWCRARPHARRAHASAAVGARAGIALRRL